MNKGNLHEYEEEIECSGENEEIRVQTEKLGDSGNKELTEAEDKELDNRSSVAKDVNVIVNGDEVEMNTPSVKCTASVCGNVSSVINSNSTTADIANVDTVIAEKSMNVVNNSGSKMYEMFKEKSYAKVAETSVIDRNLSFTPTAISDEGNEVVIFDEELVLEGSKKWQFTLCGRFVGCNMSELEAKYNLRRMWSRFGIREILSNGNGIWFFKFIDEENMNSVVDQSPWLVNGKPLIVQKWSPVVCIEKAWGDLRKRIKGDKGFSLLVSFVLVVT